MDTGHYILEKPQNEPILSYAPGSPERSAVLHQLDEMTEDVLDIPMVIGGEEIRTENTQPVVCPHDHQKVLGHAHQAQTPEVELAIEAALKAKTQWAEMPWHDRIAIFSKAADLLASKYRYIINAATMLGQGKNVYQAEIDAACELIDFLRFNVYYASQIYSEQPDSVMGEWNRLDYRPLEGFVFAVTPFNFTAIAGNLPTAPAIMGNTVVWKPASSAIYSAHFIMQVFLEAGLPPGVINLVYGSGRVIGNEILKHPDLAGVHFTGSTEVFQGMWRTVGEQIDAYKTYPRLVGETGGKDFIVVHPTADIEVTVTALIRGAFEYQGQKCSAASRAYIPRSMWSEVLSRLKAELQTIKMGSPSDPSNFVNAVIDKDAFDSITEYIDYARDHEDATILWGGDYDDSTGYFIDPTVITTEEYDFKTMEEEIFGPVLTLAPYDDDNFEAILDVVDKTSPYALTGAIIAQDRAAIDLASRTLRQAAGNFYINDKPTGSIVGRQPFGGARASGTNDKAGSPWNLIRWTSPRAIKENFIPARDYRYPFLGT